MTRTWLGHPDDDDMIAALRTLDPAPSADTARAYSTRAHESLETIVRTEPTETHVVCGRTWSAVAAPCVAAARRRRPRGRGCARFCPG